MPVNNSSMKPLTSNYVADYLQLKEHLESKFNPDQTR